MPIWGQIKFLLLLLYITKLFLTIMLYNHTMDGKEGRGGKRGRRDGVERRGGETRRRDGGGDGEEGRGGVLGSLIQPVGVGYNNLHLVTRLHCLCIKTLFSLQH